MFEKSTTLWTQRKDVANVISCDWREEDASENVTMWLMYQTNSMSPDLTNINVFTQSNEPVTAACYIDTHTHTQQKDNQCLHLFISVKTRQRVELIFSLLLLPLTTYTTAVSLCTLQPCLVCVCFLFLAIGVQMSLDMLEKRFWTIAKQVTEKNPVLLNGHFFMNLW